MIAPIATTKEERQKAIENSIARAIIAGTDWACPSKECNFHRRAGTRRGYIRIAANHLFDEHHIRLEIR